MLLDLCLVGINACVFGWFGALSCLFCSWLTAGWLLISFDIGWLKWFVCYFWNCRDCYFVAWVWRVVWWFSFLFSLLSFFGVICLLFGYYGLLGLLSMCCVLYVWISVCWSAACELLVDVCVCVLCGIVVLNCVFVVACACVIVDFWVFYLFLLLGFRFVGGLTFTWIAGCFFVVCVCFTFCWGLYGDFGLATCGLICVIYFDAFVLLMLLALLACAYCCVLIFILFCGLAFVWITWVLFWIAMRAWALQLIV